ncbi:MAG: hypothetical protein KJ697_04980 [Nanoarchaeota archaeon]|nr:hypothetical protein [Nanoarchaeota archaeon]MBU4123981.1 hypothetical protein [Nanoarchaeota archaeon]
MFIGVSLNIKNFFIKYWWAFALAAIFFISYYVRSINIIPDRILSFDPMFQFRFTKYFADWGVLPNWDELTYYVGRPINSTLLGPLMAYITSAIYWLVKGFGISLLTVCSYASAIYGAMIVFPAFLLGREISNKYGGLLAAGLIGTAPQILIRTFGSSYDTDQLALFFIVLTIYLGIYALRKKTITSYAMAFTGFLAFMFAWGLFIYSFIMVAIYTITLLVLTTLMRKEDIKEGIKSKPNLKENFKHAMIGFKKEFLILTGLAASLIGVGYLLKTDIFIQSLISIIGFAGKAESWIVNISIAELQAFNIFNLNGWMLAMGQFVTGVVYIDMAVFLTFVSFIFFGLYAGYKKDINKISILLTLALIAVATTFRGIRFTEFSSALFIIVIGAGYGYFVDWSKKNDFMKVFAIGVGICIMFIAVGVSMQLGTQLGPDMNSNWDGAWNFIKTQTPQLSIIGTWWDPGHMIASIAERRNFADGAHCPEPCMYNINDRIVDLGKIMATTNEDESLQLIKKYQGDSPKVYWIASDDLIGKFQWLQYFGTGCDARSDASCPLYYQAARSDIKYDEQGQASAVYFGNIIILPTNIPIPIITQGKSAAVVKEVIFYDNEGNIQTIDLSDSIEMIKPFGADLKLNIVDDVVPITVWIQKQYGYVIIIPQTLREAVFTKMYFMRGQGLKCFNLVYDNEQVKIFEVNTACKS